jgi:hypothetical protein
MEWINAIPDVEFGDRTSPDSPNDLYGMVYVNNSDGAGWPTWAFDEDDEEYEFDFFHEISQFLAPGEVAIFQEVGAEKLRYLFGQSIAVNHKGEILSVDLNDIVDKVKSEWGVSPTACSY